MNKKIESTFKLQITLRCYTNDEKNLCELITNMDRSERSVIVLDALRSYFGLEQRDTVIKQLYQNKNHNTIDSSNQPLDFNKEVVDINSNNGAKKNKKNKPEKQKDLAFNNPSTSTQAVMIENNIDNSDKIVEKDGLDIFLESLNTSFSKR